MHQGLPPPLLPAERATVHPALWRALGTATGQDGSDSRGSGDGGGAGADSITDSSTLVRLIRPGCARLTIENGMCVLYHSLHNGRTMHAAALPSLEFESTDGPALEMLLTSYPEWVRVGALPLQDVADRVELANALYVEGVLMAQLKQEYPTER